MSSSQEKATISSKASQILFFKNTIFLLLLHCLVAAGQIVDLYCATQDLHLQHVQSSSLTRARTLALVAQRLSHSTTREVPSQTLLRRWSGIEAVNESSPDTQEHRGEFLQSSGVLRFPSAPGQLFILQGPPQPSSLAGSHLLPPGGLHALHSLRHILC